MDAVTPECPVVVSDNSYTARVVQSLQLGVIFKANIRTRVPVLCSNCSDIDLQIDLR